MGSARGQQRAATMQHSYNLGYLQCMAANGEQVQQPAAAHVVYAAPYGRALYLPVSVQIAPALPPL
jgi:hypothetical protein